MIHPDTEVRFISPTIGYGVVATKLIPKGTITWVQDKLDCIYPPEKVDNLPPILKDYLETYCFTNHKGEKVLCWDNAKYVNHSFNPSCFSTAYDFEIAIRDIQPGEQLTDDYGYLNLEIPFIAEEEEGSKRKVVYPDDIVTFHKEWDELIRSNIPLVFEQEQPLLPFLNEHKWEQFAELKQDPSKMISILTCHYQPEKAFHLI